MDKSTIYLASQEGFEKAEVKGVMLETAQSRCNTVDSDRSTLKFEPNQSSAEKSEAELLNKNDLSPDILQANIVEEERLVVISDITLNTPRKNTAERNHAGSNDKFDQNKQEVNCDIREYNIKLKEQLNIIVSTEPQRIEPICNIDPPANLLSTIEPVTNIYLQNPPEITSQIKFSLKYHLTQSF